MPTTYYRVEIQENKGLDYRQVRNPRSSVGKRTYSACVVATATLATVEHETNQLMAAETALARTDAELVALKARMGLTVEEATALHTAALTVWWALVRTYEDKVREGRVGLARALTDADRKRAKDLATADGHLDPYLPGNPHDLVELDRQNQNARRSIAHYTKRNVKVGDQMVVSWHKDVNAAQKGLKDAQYLRQTGFTLEIRTDVIVSDSKR